MRAYFTREKIGPPPDDSLQWNEEQDSCGYENSAHRERTDCGNGPRFSLSMRMGQTKTMLPDGRTVYIAGEVEDFYDPDFCIYNDVVVRHPSGDIEIFLYRKSDFQPTDFHTATLVGDIIFIIGCFGYKDMRESGYTPVYALDLGTMSMKRLDVAGKGPGVWDHAAVFEKEMDHRGWWQQT